MEKIITEIKEAIKKQGLSETKAAKMAGLRQAKVNRMLKGETKKIDYVAAKKLIDALGLVAEPPPAYGVTQVIQGLTPEETELIRIAREYPEVAAVVRMMGSVDCDTQKDIQRNAEKEKRMHDALKELQDKKAG